MKILVVSLLRIGDLVMALPAIDELRRRHPRARIHLLTHDSNRGVVPLLPGITRCHYLDRQLLQEGLGDASVPLLTSYDLLREMVDALNEEHFDLIVNVTHTRFSGYLCALLGANEKIGLVVNDKEQAVFGSPWIRHLNEFGRAPVNCFHFSDYFKFGAAGGEAKAAPYRLRETTQGKSEASCWNSASPLILVQTSTSVEKKHWTNEHWLEFFDLFHRLQPEAELRLLAAPGEGAGLADLVKSAEARGVTGLGVIEVSLEGAYSLIKRSRLVISTDTSIKHLAAFAGVPVIELAFGGADFRRTGAYSDRVLILASKEKCRPCGHSSPCRRERRFCAENLSGEAVAALVAPFYRNDSAALRKTAEELSDEVDVYLGRFAAGGFWWPQRLCDSSGEFNTAYLLELFSWKMLLTNAHLERVVPYGEHVRDLRDSIEAPVSALVYERMFRRLSENTEDILRLRSELVGDLRRSLLGAPLSSRIERELERLEGKLDYRDVLMPLWRSTAGQGLGQVRQVQRLLGDLDQIHQIRIKILQSLRDSPREQI